MDFKLLEKIIIEDLKQLEVNTYDVGKLGTINLAQKYVNKIEGCSSKLPGKQQISFYYLNKKFGGIMWQRSSTNSAMGIKVSRDKIKTEKYLLDNNVRTTRSYLFESNEFTSDKAIIDRSDSLMVVKPLNLNAGKGVTINVNSDNFKFSWNQVIDAYKKSDKPAKVIVQNQIAGIEARLLVVEGKFNSAILRAPANVIGDGKSTIEELISLKNLERKSNPHLGSLPLKITENVKYNLQERNLSFNSVLDQDEVFYLHHSSNISLGGDSYEVSHLINDSMKQISEDAVKSIPGLKTAGVDIMFESFSDLEPFVLEINYNANLRMHHFPWKGEPKRPIYDLIDQMLENHQNKQIK